MIIDLQGWNGIVSTLGGAIARVTIPSSFLLPISSMIINGRTPASALPPWLTSKAPTGILRAPKPVSWPSMGPKLQLVKVPCVYV